MRRALLALCLAVAACQPLPHPFADYRPPDGSPLLSPPDSLGVVVAPVAGLPAPLDGDLAAAMAAALRDADVPASIDSANRRSFRLVGKAQPAGDPGGMSIDWAMVDAGGKTVGRESQAIPGAADLERGGDALAKSLVRQTAPALAKLVVGDAPLPAANADTVVMVRPVTGAAGDGDTVLTRSLVDALQRANIKIATAGGPKESFVVTGRVEMSPPQGGKQQVKVNWALVRPDGSQVGQVSQANAVPAGSLDGPWGEVAYAVASAAVPGITALIERARAAEAESSGS